jgi:hypothetical protein
MRLEIKHRCRISELSPRAERDPGALRLEHNDAETVITAPRRVKLEAGHSEREVTITSPFSPPIRLLMPFVDGQAPEIEVPLKGGWLARIWYGGKHTQVEIRYDT